MEAQQYVQLLESELVALRQQLYAQQQQQQQQLGAGEPAVWSALSGPYDTSSSSSSGGGGIGPLSSPQGTHMVPTSSTGGASAAAAGLAAATALGYGVSGGGGPELLEYVRRLDAASLAALSACGPDVADGMTAFVARLMGTTEREQLASMSSEFSAVDLSKVRKWMWMDSFHQPCKSKR
jgi:alkanesulfonate monooxygenase SsuD/methylene tetrahydromethanopterin reductase-like flavin-dependent oxidoreductase (luciferase family)